MSYIKGKRAFQESLLSSLDILAKESPKLITKNTINMLLDVIEKSDMIFIAQALQVLYTTSPDLFYNKNAADLLEGQPSYSLNNARMLSILYKTNPDLINNANLIKLLEEASNKPMREHALKTLYEATPSPINNDILDLLFKIDNVEDLAPIVIKSYEVNKELCLNNNFLQLLNEKSESLSQINDSLNNLCVDDWKEWVTKDTIIAVIEAGDHASIMVSALIKLHNFDCYNSKNVATIQELLKQEKNGSDISNELSINMEKTESTLTKFSIFANIAHDYPGSSQLKSDLGDPKRNNKN